MNSNRIDYYANLLRGVPMADLGRKVREVLRDVASEAEALAPHEARIKELEALYENSVAKCAELEAELLNKEGMTCGDCNDTGWLENREEGRYPCTCMTEAEPYQILQAKCAELRVEADFNFQQYQDLGAVALAGDLTQESKFNQLCQDMDRMTEQRDAALARIDELMLEYCPGEMAPEQLEEWGRNQRRVTLDTLTAEAQANGDYDE